MNVMFERSTDSMYWTQGGQGTRKKGFKDVLKSLFSRGSELLRSK